MTEHIYVKIQGGENTQSCELTAVNYLVLCGGIIRAEEEEEEKSSATVKARLLRRWRTGSISCPRLPESV